MDPEERNLLRETVKLARKNNEILVKMRRAQVFGRTLRIFYWVIIIGAALGAFYFLQPYVDQLRDVYGNVQEGVGVIQDVVGGVQSIVE